MEKQDIYEHLAEIYLDASLSSKKKQRPSGNIVKYLLVLAAAAAILGIIVFLMSSPSKRPPLTENALLLSNNNPIKITYNFKPGNKELSTLALNSLDLRLFKQLGFSARSDSSPDSMPAIGIEIESRTGEKGLVYIRDAGKKWQEYKIPFTEFKPVINDWSQIKSLSFVVEEWNSRQKKGVVFIDNIRFLR